MPALGAMLYRCYLIKCSHWLLRGAAAIPTILMMQKLRFRATRNADILRIFPTDILTAAADASFLCSLHVEEPGDKFWCARLSPRVPLPPDGGSLSWDLDHSLHSGARFLAPRTVV